ncbi:MAG TPA: flagellar hook capping FlgD N-terminal domain-containing protein [Lacipirellulaceae bacterium]|nr:flagellar hook capping FlgD N-terminal domain-containing protein [Lacipirellulaceae bacterium]
MSTAPNVNTFNQAFAQQQVGAGGINDVNIDDFLKIMITELQNQDPLNPLENSELIAQISQIRSVGATEKLTQTLDSVLLGQNIASATNLIGADIDGLSDDGQRVTGVVDRVSVAGGRPKLHLDLNPRATVNEQEEGRVEAGLYEYRVVWHDDGVQFGVDPLDGGVLNVWHDDSAVQISNLPVSKGPKQVYRREVGETSFRLVGSMTDGSSATFLDAKSERELSETVLTGAPQMMDPQRKFVVSLQNVGEIRPPRRL